MSSLKLLGEPAGGGPHTHPEADIEDGTILARLAASETITGPWTFPGLKLTAGIKDSGGTVRAIIQDTSPFIILGDPTAEETGDTVIMGRAAIGNSGPTLKTYSQVHINRQPPTGRGCGLNIGVGFDPPDPANGYLWGLSGIAQWAGYGTGTLCAGLNFEAYANMYDGTLNSLEGVRVRIYTNLYDPAAVSQARGLHVLRPLSGGGGNRPTKVTGLYIEDQYSAAGLTTPTDVIGIRIDDFSGGTNRYLLELGPTVPYMRLVGGAAPGANQTNLYLNVGGTLRRVQWKLYSDLVAGDRVMVLV